MNRFGLTDAAIDGVIEKHKLDDSRAGACAIFEGWVRDHNEGRCVCRLDYQAYAPLALTIGEAVLAEAMQRFGLRAAYAVHRTGTLDIGELAVWVGVSADHRGSAFDACRWAIDEIKLRVPIWKNEHYADGESGWLHPDNTPVASDS